MAVQIVMDTTGDSRHEFDPADPVSEWGAWACRGRPPFGSPLFQLGGAGRAVHKTALV